MPFSFPFQLPHTPTLPLTALVILTLLVIYRKLGKIYSDVKHQAKTPHLHERQD